MSKKITVDEWIDIAADLITLFSEKFEDDGKISVSDGLALLLVLLRDIATAFKNGE